MPSARELLEQADALMRRNRSRETISPAMGPRTMTPGMGPRTLTPAFSARRAAVEAGDFPVLTEALDAAAEPRMAAAPMREAPELPAARPQRETPGLSQTRVAYEPPPRDMRTPPITAAQLAPRVTPETPRVMPEAPRITPEAPRITPEAPRITPETPRPIARQYGDVPVLTDAIEEIDAALIAAASEGEPSIWNVDAMRGDDSVLGPSPRSIAVIPDAREIQASHQRNATAAAESAAASASAVAASTAELIEEVRMQVLQRIDMFTDTGLRDQLGERLKPIVDRASAELVATINQHVGELLRTYVAEAIERELDRLRNDLN